MGRKNRERLYSVAASFDEAARLEFDHKIVIQWAFTMHSAYCTVEKLSIRLSDHDPRIAASMEKDIDLYIHPIRPLPTVEGARELIRWARVRKRPEARP